MIYSFQSLRQTAHIEGKPPIVFNGYLFTTESEEVAERMRRNCKSNPSQYWEITPEVLATDPVAEEIVKRKPGRPKAVKIIVGQRTSDDILEKP